MRRASEEEDTDADGNGVKPRQERPSIEFRLCRLNSYEETADLIQSECAPGEAWGCRAYWGWRRGAVGERGKWCISFGPLIYRRTRRKAAAGQNEYLRWKSIHTPTGLGVQSTSRLSNSSCTPGDGQSVSSTWLPLPQKNIFFENELERTTDDATVHAELAGERLLVAGPIGPWAGWGRGTGGLCLYTARARACGRTNTNCVWFLS